MQSKDKNPYHRYIQEAFNPEAIPDKGGKVGWQSPSNIAIVKYWGKFGLQLPRNASISFTLKEAQSQTTIQYKTKSQKGMSFHFLFEGKEQPHFSDKIGKYLHALLPYFPFLEFLDMHIESSNTFPHSSGIASSASAMSALIMCLIDIEQQFSEKPKHQDHILQKASYLARLGSGSAARSLFPYAASWGLNDSIAGSSNYFASPLSGHIHKVFKSYHDSILIISGKEKAVPSRAGHELMENNPFAMVRYSLAKANISKLMDILNKGDLEGFCQVTESEALQLHALMMTSEPSYMLLEPQTIGAIKAVRSFRKETGIPVCFTLDAGPNLHLLYPDENADQVKDLIINELVSYCHQKQWINDQLGEGPSKLF